MTFSNNILSSIRHIIFISIPISICPCNDETETDDLRANKNSHRLLFVFHSSVCSFTQSINALSFSRILFALDCQLIAYNKYLFTRSFFCLFRQLIRIGDLPFRAKNKNIYSYFYYLLIDHISFHALPCFLFHSLCVAQWSIDVECILLSSVAIYIATDCVDAFLFPHISIDCGQKNNNNGNLIPLEIRSFPFYPDCNIYSPSMFAVRLDIFYMFEYWKLFELRGKSISLTSMARTTHARKCLWIVQITTMRAINHSLSERLKCKHNNTCTHTHTFFPQQNYFYCYWWHYYLGLG